MGPPLALRWARPLVLNLGPNDAEYVQGFREDWERDGRTIFHWTSPSASVRLPFALRGEGWHLRMRVRRHFVEPAIVTITIEGAPVARFPLQADPRRPYPILEFPLPRLQGQAPFALLVQSRSENPRPLGLALDWLEIVRSGPDARVVTLWPLSWRWTLVLVSTFLVLRLASLPLLWSAIATGVLALAGSVGLAWDPMAAERILRHGAVAYAVVALAAAGLVRLAAVRSVLALSSPRVGGVLVLLVLIALAVRITILLHPQFFYPDVRVHALFARELAKRGLVEFMQTFTANQFRFSLGLQYESGHWYAFPYPATFYVLCWPLVRLFRYLPEVAVSLVGAIVNSLETLLVYGIARRLAGSSALALAAAAAVPLLPLFLTRLSLAYFPALLGHAMDAIAILYLLARLDELNRPRVVIALSGLLALAFLTYTQSPLNFGILLPLFLALQVAFDRGPGARSRQVGLAAAGVIGVLLAIGLFYARYVPLLLDMRRGVPMAEEAILLDKIARQPPTLEKAAPDVDDLYAGPDVSLTRGARKAGWRLWLFYGIFAPVVVLGVVGLYLGAGGPTNPTNGARGPIGRFIAAWGLTYLLLNLASGGLPGPNLVRYNKDLEIVAPLCCAALGQVGVWLSARARWLGLAYGAAFWLFGAMRAVQAMTSKFVMER